jgi:hypothetical protein
MNAQAILNAATTGRERPRFDFIRTPEWVTATLLEHAPPPRDKPIMDPCAGDGAILRVLLDAGWTREQLFACELRGEERPGLVELLGEHRVFTGDWYERRQEFNLAGASIVANVPFSQMPRFPEACLDRGADYVALLFPVEEIAGVNRSVWFNKHRPTTVVGLAKRPFPASVRGVAWFCWQQGKDPIDLVVA